MNSTKQPFSPLSLKSEREEGERGEFIFGETSPLLSLFSLCVFFLKRQLFPPPPHGATRTDHRKNSILAELEEPVSFY